MASERGLIQRAKRNLERHGFRVEEQALVGSSAPDLVVTSPQGTSAVIEAKEWPASEAGMRRASDLAHVYSSVSGSFAAFTLLPYVPPSSSAPNVISPDYLDPLISRLSRPPSSSARKPRLKRGETPSVNLFVAMPFDGRFEKPFELAVKPAALAAGTQCVRIDKEFYVGDVVAAIKKAIRASSAVLADLSASNPNVLYEAGYAHALRKPVVQICSTTFKKLPFDVRNNNTLHYKASALDSLRRRLTKTLISAKPRWHTRSTKAA